MTDKQIDIAIEALRDNTRRKVLKVIEDTGEMGVEKLTAEVSAATGIEQKLIQLSLEHSHLPKLEQANAVNRTGDIVTPGPRCSELVKAADAIADILNS